ncbi:MAG: bifunctional 5,10-methylenetetrahydrofolate dehydrogenase/5,10-methenyltetrahydrofolate cyclohydrolase [bacterium]
MILDGKRLAADILSRARARSEQLGRMPTLRVVACGGNAATASYLKIKEKRAAEAGIGMIVQTLPETATTTELIAAVTAATEDALIVQLPLPATVDTQAVLDAIPVEKDADVLSSAARARFERGEDGALLPPVVGAVAEIVRGVSIAGKKAVVIGNGWLVGAPVATWLNRQGADVSIATIETAPEELARMLSGADIIVAGAGSAGLVKPEIIKEGVILIDAGTSESGGVIRGDADPAGAEKCSLFTPVPGGVGPVAVAKLFENVIELAEYS